MATVVEREPVLAEDAESGQLRALLSLLQETPSGALAVSGPGDERALLPASVQALLASAVRELARGNAVSVVPVHAELTTQEAADLLNVSRPFLVKLVETGAIPFHHVGTHRRIKLADVLAYRNERSHARRAALAEMAREAQEMGLYE